jgi:hypothetical protein
MLNSFQHPSCRKGGDCWKSTISPLLQAFSFEAEREMDPETSSG